MLIEVEFSLGTLSNHEGESFVFSFGVFSVFLNMSFRAVGSLSKELAVMVGGEVRDCGVEGGGDEMDGGGLEGGGDHSNSGDRGLGMDLLGGGDEGLVRDLLWRGDSGLGDASLVSKEDGGLGRDFLGGGEASLAAVFVTG